MLIIVVPRSKEEEKEAFDLVQRLCDNRECPEGTLLTVVDEFGAEAGPANAGRESREDQDEYLKREV